MSFAFKRFNFFQPQQIARHGFPPNASCVVPGGPLLWVGTESGSVFALDSRLSLIGTFSAHGHKVLEVLWLERRQLLVTVGVEEPGCSSTTVKLWAAERLVAAVAAAAGGGDGGTAAASGGGGGGGGGGVTAAGAGAAVVVAAAGANSLGGILAAITREPLKTTKVFGYHSGAQYPESPVTAAAAAEGGGGGGGGSHLAASGGGGGGAGLAGPASSGSSSVGGGSASASVGGGDVAAATSTSLTIALGLASGSVVVLVGEVHAGGSSGPGRAKLSHSRRLSARPDEGDLLAVTGLELTGTSDLLSLFVVTESQTLCFHLQTNTKTVLDPQGSSAPRCCCLRPGGSLLTVARAEGLYDYTADTRAGCTAFEGVKQRLTTFGRYLVVVTRDDSASAAASATGGVGLGGGLGGGTGLGLGFAVPPVSVALPPSAVGGGGGLGGGGGGGSSSCLQLADVRTKLLAGTFVLQGLQHVFCAWGAVHAVTASGGVWSYREIDLASQLEALLRRSLHKLALDVARCWGPAGGGGGGGGGYNGINGNGPAADAATLANIHQRWGDHLYSKGEYDAAMTQYLETVGQLEPSYVIRRFLDAQRIHNLTAYLESLHERGLATCDHTTLLLNCYTKLKDVSKLDAFIRRGGVTAAAPTAPANGGGAESGGGGGGGGGGGPDPSLVRRPRRHLTSAAALAASEAAAATATAASSSASAGGRKSSRQTAAAAAAEQQQQPQHPPPQAPSLRFDADTAVRVLRGAGYAEHALWVADAAGQIDAVLDILLDELGDGDDAIAYLEMLPRARRAEALKKYGKSLIGLRPEAATGLIMDLCCGPQPTTVTTASGTAGPHVYLASVSDFAHLYSGEPTALMLLCEYILNTNSAANSAASAAAAAAAAAHASGGGGGGGGADDAAAAAAERSSSYERLLYHTLLELYLADQLWQQPNSQPSTQPTPQPPTQQQPPTPQQKQQQQQQQQAVKQGGKKPAKENATVPPLGPAAASTPASASATATPTAAPEPSAAPAATATAGPSGAPPHHHHRSVSAPVDPGPVAVASSSAAAYPSTAAASTPASTSTHGAGLAAGLDTEARRTKALDLLARGWPPHVQLPPTSSSSSPHDPPASAAGGSGYGGGYNGYNGPSYDPDHALVLCRLHGFRRGLLFLYDRLRLPREALQVYMSCGDHAGLISAVQKYGDASRGGDPVLWSEVLDYFVARHDADPPAGSDCSGWISQVIEHVERSGVLPPLVVLQTLSRSRRLPLSLVRGYMERVLQRDTAAVAADREAVSRLAAETAALRDEVTRLRTQPRFFTASRCSGSGAPLELPVVHFLCGHSYNLRQLGDSADELSCPLCGPDQKRVADIRASLQAASLQPERFFAELRQAADGFAVVAEHFGRGLMNPPTAATAAAAAAAAAAPGGGGAL